MRFIAPRFGRYTHNDFRVPNTPLQRQDPRIFGIVVYENSVDLPLNFIVELFLSFILSLLLLSAFVLFIQDCVSCLHNVHLQQSTRSVFLSRNDCYLLLVILQLSDHVVEHCFQTVHVPTHGELVFRLVTSN